MLACALGWLPWRSELGLLFRLSRTSASAASIAQHSCTAGAWLDDVQPLSASLLHGAKISKISDPYVQ